VNALAQLDPWAPSAKAWSNRCVKFAQHRKAVFRSDPDDPGAQRFFVVSVDGSVQLLPDAEALDRLIERLDAASHNREASAT
jgi:hypothetical protein